MPMKTSLKGMLILSVYYILVLIQIKFFMYNCVSHTLCLHSFRYAIPHEAGTVLNNIERTFYSTNDVILWGRSSIDLVTQSCQLPLSPYPLPPLGKRECYIDFMDYAYMFSAPI